MKTTIVFYSMSGNTRFTAEKIADNLSAELTELIPVKEYPSSGFRKFLWGGKSAVMGDKPKLRDYSFDKKCEMLVFGTPVWAGNFTPPLRTFIEENREVLKDKRFAVFVCYSGGGADKAIAKLKKLLNSEGFAAELVLIDPKDKLSEENEKLIYDFCDKLKEPEIR